MEQQELIPTQATPEELWSKSWQENLDRQRAVEQDTSLWRASGTATIANPNKEDGNWWQANGLNMVKNWVNFRTTQELMSLWVTPQGVPAIELVFNINLDGVMVKGALDRMMVLPDGSLVVLDIKSGTYALVRLSVRYLRRSHGGNIRSTSQVRCILGCTQGYNNRVNQPR